MKFWKHSIITAIAFFTITATVLYSSCEKDPCADLKCINGGACSLGLCNCPTGYEGTLCETMAGDKFVGKFIGNHTCPSASPVKDTVEIWYLSKPDRLMFVQYSKKSDTLTGTAVKNTNTLNFDIINNGSYRKYSIATFNNYKLTIYIDEVYNVNTGSKQTCNFIGFR
jgi:hypothetical protein